MVLTDNLTSFQNVYCGGPFAADHFKTYKNTIAMSPLKNFLKLKRTVQLIGNSQLAQTFKQIDNMERYAMTEYQLYEKKQERNLVKISKTSSNRRLRKLERLISNNNDPELRDSEPENRLYRKRRKRVVAKKRAGVGGTYMKRLKLASDSLKNTDPEASVGTVLNMESYLAFKDYRTQPSKAGKARKKSRRPGMVLSKTEHKALQISAQSAMDRLIPRWKESTKQLSRMTDEEILAKKEELFDNISDLHVSLPVSDLLEMQRQGFRPSKVKENFEKRTSMRTKLLRRDDRSGMIFSNSIPLPTGKREIPKFFNRRELAENNEIFKLTKAIKHRELRVEEEIALIGSYAGLTRSSYLRDDEDTLREKRLEFNQQLDKLHRKKLSLQTNWINVVKKRRSLGDVSLAKTAKNAPMIPLIPNLAKRIRKMNKNPLDAPKKTNIFMDILGKISEEEPKNGSPTKEFSLPVLPNENGHKPSRQPSIEEFQKAFNLPTRTVAQRRVDTNAENHEKRLQRIASKGSMPKLPLKRTDSKISLPPIATPPKPIKHELVVPSTALTSLLGDILQVTPPPRMSIEEEPILFSPESSYVSSEDEDYLRELIRNRKISCPPTIN